MKEIISRLYKCFKNVELKKQNINYYELNFKFDKQLKVKMNKKSNFIIELLITYKKRFQKLNLHYISTVYFSFLI